MKRVNIKCPYCRSQAFLRPASLVHQGKNTEPGEEVYVCARYPFCDSYVSAHRRSHLPMGTLANRELRNKRRLAHAAFDQLWESGLMSRKEAYHWLQMQMGLPEEEAHIGNFSEYRCDQVIRLCDSFQAAAECAA